MDKPHVNSHSHPDSADPQSTLAATETTIYTCPMHPEIRQTNQGSCPVCGMALEPLIPMAEDEDNPELRDFRRRFWWTLPLTIVVTFIAMFWHRIVPIELPEQNFIELALSTPVVLWAGWSFFQRAVQSVVRGSPNMWTLIGLGVAAAYGYSVVATLALVCFPLTLPYGEELVFTMRLRQ